MASLHMYNHLLVTQHQATRAKGETCFPNTQRCISVYTFLKGGRGGGSAALLSVVTSNRTLGNGIKLHQGKFRSDIRKRFFTERVVCHWNRLLREVVTAPSLSEFKEHLDDTVNHIV